MKTKLFITAAIVFSFFISCNRNSESARLIDSDVAISEIESPDLLKSMNKEQQQIPVGKYPLITTDTISSPSQNAISNPDWDSKIIKTASMKLEIKDFKKYNDYVHNAVKMYGAYVAQEEQVLTDEKTETVIAIKVPVAQFETMMNKLPGEDGKVMEKRINTDDVTGEMVDTKSRLETRKQLRLKYLEFLKQSKNREEALQAQNEINNIQEQIESTARRVGFLSHQTSYSTINLTFYQPMEGYSPTDSNPSFLKRISAAFTNGMSWVSNLLVGLISVWPLFFVFAGIYFGWKILKPKKTAVQNI